MGVFAGTDEGHSCEKRQHRRGRNLWSLSCLVVSCGIKILDTTHQCETNNLSVVHVKRWVILESAKSVKTLYTVCQSIKKET